MATAADPFDLGRFVEAQAEVYGTAAAELYECTRLVNAVRDRSVEEIFGTLDAIKVRSSMTLFARVADHAAGAESRALLDRYYGGEEDPATLDRLGLPAGPD